MSKSVIKESKYVILAYVVFALIILGSLVSKFNIYDLFYLVAVTLFVIRYIVAISLRK